MIIYFCMFFHSYIVQLQNAVVEGSLHCSGDEAIGLAGLQFRIEKISEQRHRTPDSLNAISPDSLMDGSGMCNMLQPISEDKEHYLQLEVPASSPPIQPLQHHPFNAVTLTSPTVTDEPSTRKTSHFVPRSCGCFWFRRRCKSVPERDPFGIVHKVHMYVPPDYRNPKVTAKLIKVSEIIRIL